jgi:hypothetical protein
MATAGKKIFTVKTWIFVSVFCLAFMFMCRAAYADTPLKVGDMYAYTPQRISESRLGVVISGVVPRITVNNDAELSDTINRKIENEFRRHFTGAGRVLRFIYSYEIIEDDANSIVSVILICTNITNIGNPIETVKTINFDPLWGRMLNVNDVLGANGVKLVNQLLFEELKANPGVYNPHFAGISNNQNFYVRDNIFYAVFNRNEIAPGVMGRIDFPLDISKKIDYVMINAPELTYRAPHNLNVRMVQLREVGVRLGFGLVWHDAMQIVEIYDDTLLTNFLTSFRIGRNAYTRIGSVSPIILETVPELRNDRAFVPLSFFEVILNILYTINADGTITFSRYVG